MSSVFVTESKCYNSNKEIITNFLLKFLLKININFTKIINMRIRMISNENYEDLDLFHTKP